MDRQDPSLKPAGVVCYVIMQSVRDASSQTGIQTGTKTKSESVNDLRHCVGSQVKLLPTSQCLVERPKSDQFGNKISEGQHFEFTRSCLSAFTFKESLHQNNKLTSSYTYSLGHYIYVGKRNM